MSDALTLTESRAVLMGLMRSPGMPSAEEAEDAIDALLAAHLRDLAGTPDSETMERAVEVLVCSPRLDFCSRCGDDGHQCHNCTVAGMWQDAERDLRLAYPLLVAPIRAEVERLKGELQGVNAVADQIHANNVVLIANSIYNEERLATAEARVRELGDAVRGLLHVIRADQLVPESVSYMKMAAKAVGMEAE